jgi:hypothetical protein
VERVARIERDLRYHVYEYTGSPLNWRSVTDPKRCLHTTQLSVSVFSGKKQGSDTATIATIKTNLPSPLQTKGVFELILHYYIYFPDNERPFSFTDAFWNSEGIVSLL